MKSMEELKKIIEENIIDVPDFPKQGVLFKDITKLLKDHFSDLIDAFSLTRKNWDDIDYIVGIESRGFILGCALAQKLNKGFIPIRKKGKLPPPIIGKSYALEYGEDTLEMKTNTTPAKILLIDDVLATGGTLKAALSLCSENKYEVQTIAMLLNLTFLNQFKNESSIDLQSLIEL